MRAAHEGARVVRRVDPAVHGGDHVSGLHLFAVVEEDAVAQVIGVDAVFVAQLPGLGELGDELVVDAEGDELFIHGAVDDLGGDVHRGHGDVEVLRLAVQRDVQDVSLGTGAAAEADQKGQTEGECEREGKCSLHSGFLLHYPRTDLPARRSSIKPSRRTGFPPSRTHSIPAGGVRGSAKVARSFTVSGSKISTSASAPAER